jgi:hypothetical protein
MSAAILSNVPRSAIFRWRRSRLLMMPRVVKTRNALLTASSNIPRYSPISDRVADLHPPLITGLLRQCPRSIIHFAPTSISQTASAATVSTIAAANKPIESRTPSSSR